MAKLTARQQRFVEEYLIDLNATQAAIRAGYSPNTANEQSSRLLTNVNIRACVDRAIAERSKRTGVNADRVIQELARIAFIDPTKVINTDTAKVYEDASEDDRAAIASVKYKKSSGETTDTIEREVKFADKIKALELLGKHLGMFTDKIQIDGTVPVQIIDDIPKGG